MERIDDMKIIGDAADGRSEFEMAFSLKPDVVLIDMGMPVLNGIDTTNQLRARGFVGGIVMLSMHNERRIVHGARMAGADGYLLKEYAFEQLKEAVKAAARRESYYSAQLQFLEDDAGMTGLLTAREREVLQRLAEGCTAKEIAFSLKLSSKTIDVHRANIQRKLNVGTLADLTRIALREGLVQL